MPFNGPPPPSRENQCFMKTLVTEVMSPGSRKKSMILESMPGGAPSPDSKSSYRQPGLSTNLTLRDIIFMAIESSPEEFVLCAKKG